MKVLTQPKPARLPLAGGREGATVRVHPLLTGEIRMPPGGISRPTGPAAELRGLGLLTPRSRSTWVPVPAFLVEHPTAGAILVDSGLHESVATDPSANLGRRSVRLLPVRMTPEQSAPALLGLRGLEAVDVRFVIMTHLHNDHASGISEFPAATFVASRAEWEAASSGGFRQGYRREQFDHAFDWRLVDYDDEAIDSHSTFARAVDLFGDGSVRLLFTPGHSTGHQSVLLRLTAGDLLLTGDAAYTRRTIDEDLEPLFRADAHVFHRSLGEIRRHLEREPGTVVICGHDADAWPGLRAVYT